MISEWKKGYFLFGKFIILCRNGKLKVVNPLVPKFDVPERFQM
jgi:hypothetical protein